MPINGAKCVYSHIGDTKVIRYSRGEEPVLVVWSHKDLGVTVSHGLNTTIHYRWVSTKRFGTLRLIDEYLLSEMLMCSLRYAQP